MTKKDISNILAERAVIHNGIIRSATNIIQNGDIDTISVAAAIEQRNAAKACLAELIIIEHRVSLLRWFDK